NDQPPPRAVLLNDSWRIVVAEFKTGLLIVPPDRVPKTLNWAVSVAPGVAPCVQLAACVQSVPVLFHVLLTCAGTAPAKATSAAAPITHTCPRVGAIGPPRVAGAYGPFARTVACRPPRPSRRDVPRANHERSGGAVVRHRRAEGHNRPRQSGNVSTRGSIARSHSGGSPPVPSARPSM